MCLSTIPTCIATLELCVTFFTNFPRIDISSQELNKHHSNTYNTINFHVYHFISHFTVNGRLPLDKSKMFRLCFRDTTSVPPAKLYTQKYLVITEI